MAIIDRVLTTVIAIASDVVQLCIRGSSTCAWWCSRPPYKPSKTYSPIHSRQARTPCLLFHPHTLACGARTHWQLRTHAALCSLHLAIHLSLCSLHLAIHAAACDRHVAAHTSPSSNRPTFTSPPLSFGIFHVSQRIPSAHPLTHTRKAPCRNPLVHASAAASHILQRSSNRPPHPPIPPRCPIGRTPRS